MSVTEIKSNLLRQIQSLDKNELEEAYGILLNYLNGKDDQWAKLTKKQQAEIEKGVRQLEAGEGISHKTVMRKHRKKYAA